VYDFPRITATGIYRSPVLKLTGNRLRYVQTVAGTTPSFTRSVNRLQSSHPGTEVRQRIDRAISLTTLNAVTASLDTSACKSVALTVSMGTAATPPVLQLEGSDDNGATWYAIGAPLTATASTVSRVTAADVGPQLLRARVSTIGVTIGTGYSVTIKGF
jgi:hypothetical protein